MIECLEDHDKPAAFIRQVNLFAATEKRAFLAETVANAAAFFVGGEQVADIQAFARTSVDNSDLELGYTEQ